MTLIELLIAVLISGIVMSAVYAVYRSQQRSYNRETAAAAMQQNARVALFNLERELRMAGCDPTGKANAGFVAADAATVRFTLDFTGGESDGKDNDNDGTIDELDTSDGIDNDNDGQIDEANESGESMFADGTASGDREDVVYVLSDKGSDGDLDLTRNGDLVAENIDALNFVYFDQNSAVLTAPVDTTRIRAVQITLVARTDTIDPDIKNTTTYRNRQNDIIYTANDSYRRILLSTIIKTRNMGI